ncbi:MAG: 3-deoxy-8-phosphooctulonate synthase [Owenweeksia sp.]|nr:3-deoxy-8-phosphooctulonate synthase [Owenweeksia sp.]MBF98053.1 3-deoxy-8-phosphooctulonate synthase [Owenweeksia sp.]HBF18761.1 3-deoxy-8-phosphooctulonate synthase [Cryomorphaceae bacterium]|tara:strand:+ start:3683 stop:4462 length:780 start_codon:yes stop_codon:yes gene_type:complete
MEKFTLIAGPCAIENDTTPFEIARRVKEICDKLDIRYIFKGSYRKANRSRLDSFTGIGDEKALEILQAVGKELGVETITDVHESHEPATVAKYVDHIQIPAFLCRQTELLLAAGETGKGVNIKKGQFLSPEAMKFPVEKVQSTGNNNVWVCERGVSFGYSDLIVDATAIHRLKQLGVPVIMDCTHSVQKPNKTEGVTGGDPSLIETIALSAMATGADGFFIETHPDPKSAKSDPHTMLQLDKLEGILTKAMNIRKALHA